MAYLFKAPGQVFSWQSFWDILFGKGRMNAFVRISTSLQDKSEAEAKQLLFDFVRDFYPLYLEYIHQNSTHKEINNTLNGAE